MFGKTDNSIQMMSPYLNQTYYTVSNHTSVVSCLRILPDGTMASGSWDTTIQIWNLTSRSVLKTLSHSDLVYSIDVLSTSLLASGSYDRSILVWNFATGQLIKNISNAHSWEITAVKNLNDYYFATGSYQGVKVGLRFYFYLFQN